MSASGRYIPCLCLILAMPLLFLAGCSSQPYNDTLFPYAYDRQQLPRKQPRVMIAPVNFGAPSKKYLAEYQGRIDRYVIERLENHGFRIVDPAPFDVAWRNAVRKYGEAYSQYTGQVNEASFKRVMYTTLKAVQESGSADAIVFTDLIERTIVYGNALNRIARWDGIARKVRMRGGVRSVPADFDWLQPVTAASLAINVYNVDGKRVFSSRGGLEATRELTRVGSSARFLRRDKLFRQRSAIEEGVALALHPLVPMDDYPEPAADPQE